MRAAIERLEQQFYARYNRANTNHRYDVILCRSLTVTGSHLDRRSCEPASLVSAPRSKIGWMSYWGPVPTDDARLSIETPSDPAELRAYQRNMVEVVRKHPELLDLVKERAALVERYQAARLRR